MDILLILALVTFLAGAVVAAIQKSWVLVLICAGLFLLALSQTGLIDS
jgi:NADH:ubiquinone oxidoreductase subunit K